MAGSREIVTTYADLAKFVRAFEEGHLTLFILVGSPGIQKSKLVADCLDLDKVCWLEGNATAFGMYRELHSNRNRPVVIDDVDGLYRDTNGIRLLKSLCQTLPRKRVSWHSASTNGERLPSSFWTTSRVCIIANEWKKLNVHVAAIEDRAHVVHFQPTPDQVHRQVATWFWDQEVYDFIGSHLAVVTSPSMRHYMLCWEKKKAGLDWRSSWLSQYVSSSSAEVAKIASDPSFSSEEERIRKFCKETGKSRSTYFAIKKKLSFDSPALCIKLANSEPVQNVEPPPVDPRHSETTPWASRKRIRLLDSQRNGFWPMTISSPDLFQPHPLSSEHCLFSGFLPNILRLDSDEFEELWQLHPRDFHVITIHGHQVETPRWQQAYGTDYHYTGRINKALPIPGILESLHVWCKEHIEKRLNGLLVNWYDGSLGHYIGKHRDSTKHMLADAPIVTISFGEERIFRLRRWKGTERYDFPAIDGSIFIMPYETNQEWTHEVPKFAGNMGRRISVTLRAFEICQSSSRSP